MMGRLTDVSGACCPYDDTGRRVLQVALVGYLGSVIVQLGLARALLASGHSGCSSVCLGMVGRVIEGQWVERA